MKNLQVFYRLFITRSVCVVLATIAIPTNAVDTTKLDVGSMAGKGWKLEGVNLTIVGLNQNKPQFQLSATKLKLPKPFDDLTFADIRCEQFTWGINELHCHKGRASVRSAYWQSPSTSFSFHLDKQKSIFKLEDARLAGSGLSLAGDITGQNWQGKLTAKHVSNELIDKLMQAKSIQVKSAKSKSTPAKPSYLNLDGMFSGHQETLLAFSVTADVDGLTDQTQDGKVATEKLILQTHLEAKKSPGKSQDWHWQSETKMRGGALYIDPVYIEAKTKPISLTAHGVWNSKTKLAEIELYHFQHPDVGQLIGDASGFYGDKVKITKADVVLHSDTLQELVTTYANPFFTESPFAGMTITGNLDAKFSFIQRKLTDSSINFSKLNIKDEAGRVAINEGVGLLNWSADAAQAKHSELSWQQLAVKGLPIESAKLNVLSQGNRFTLADKVKLPFLNGSIAVDKFSWQSKKQDEPDVSFAGSLENVSLERLSKALGWTPLSGNISGRIPGINYHNKILNLDGELLIEVFDGEVKVNNLSSSGLFGGFSKVNGDIAIDNLDLEQLTQKFEFGNITGRLSGNINNLILENWHPITFYAWLGTPDDDDSSHTISQKAVKNIASIGGGGASDVISRGFMGLFETFRYDKIGMGCYLHDGVCQVMGVEAAGQGYYLIKGYWPPRIDVLGYNPRVNWDVLVERLGRVVSSDKVIVQ